MDRNNDLYNMFKKYSYSELKELFRNAKTKDEQDFYMTLSNFLLQEKQAKVIGK
jgi:hypothetical protein